MCGFNMSGSCVSTSLTWLTWRDVFLECRDLPHLAWLLWLGSLTFLQLALTLKWLFFCASTLWTRRSNCSGPHTCPIWDRRICACCLGVLLRNSYTANRGVTVIFSSSLPSKGMYGWYISRLQRSHYGLCCWPWNHVRSENCSILLGFLKSSKQRPPYKT